MRTQESISNESISDGRQKINGSSLSSTPDNEIPSLHHKFLQFQEYQERPRIKIEDNDEIHRRISQQSQESIYPIERDFEEDKQLQLIVQYRQKIGELSDKILKLQERLFYFEDYNRRLLVDYEEAKSLEKQYVYRIAELEKSLNAKENSYLLQKQLIDTLNKKIGYLEREQDMAGGLQQLVSQKEMRIKELERVSEKVHQINRNFEVELRKANLKIVELEKEIQKLICVELCQNLAKMKENHSSNTDQNVYRKWRVGRIQSVGSGNRSEKRPQPLFPIQPRIESIKTEPNEKIKWRH